MHCNVIKCQVHFKGHLLKNPTVFPFWLPAFPTKDETTEMRDGGTKLFSVYFLISFFILSICFSYTSKIFILTEYIGNKRSKNSQKTTQNISKNNPKTNVSQKRKNYNDCFWILILESLIKKMFTDRLDIQSRTRSLYLLYFKRFRLWKMSHPLWETV